MIDFFTGLYSSIKNKNPFLSKIKYYGLQRTIIKLLTNLLVPLSLKISSNNKHRLAKGENDKLIVSLTTFPARINKIWIVVECMLRQTHKPDKIILWLSKEQFSSLKVLPKRLLKLRERGLEIEICEGDLRSHKKYVYTLRQFPNSHLITVDDDFLYPSTLIEELMLELKNEPNRIYCHRAHLMTTTNGKIDPYRKWVQEFKKESDSDYLFMTSGGGTLFPAKSLHEQATNQELFIDICRLADDVWLNAMAKLQGTTINKIRSKYSVNIPILIARNVSLSSENVDENQNDIQLIAVRKHYLKTLNKDIFAKIVR